MNDKELDACDAAFADGYARGRATAAEIERAARSLINCPDFWKNAGTLPGEYDNLVDALSPRSERREGEPRCDCHDAPDMSEPAGECPVHGLGPPPAAPKEEA